MNRYQRVTFIGTDSMGRPMVRRLLELGHPVTVHDRSPAAAAPVVAAGATWADSPREAAQAGDLVLTCLPLPHHVTENLLGPDGALAGMRPGTAWVDLSTTDYHNTLRLARAAAGQGVFSLEAPVSSLSHMGVDHTNVSFFVGGDTEGYARGRHLLDCMGRVSFFVGEIGKAQAVKLLTNHLF
jgi:3-hydroxyisobutyrate dehydrogenase